MDIQEVYERWKDDLEELQEWETKVKQQPNESAKAKFQAKHSQLAQALPATAQKLQEELKELSKHDLHFSMPNGRFTTGEDCDREINRAEESLSQVKKRLEDVRKQISELKGRLSEVSSRMDAQRGYEAGLNASRAALQEASKQAKELAKEAALEAFKDIQDDFQATVMASITRDLEKAQYVTGETVKNVCKWVKSEGWKPTSSVKEALLEHADELSKYIPELVSMLRRCEERVRSLDEKRSEAIAAAQGDPEKLAVLESEVPSSLSFDERLAINIYTEQNRTREQSLYYHLNNTLRDRRLSELKAYRGYLYYLFSALSKLPSKRCQVYRGLEDCKDDIELHYVRDRAIIWNGFTSVSTERGTAVMFARPGDRKRGGGIVLQIEVFNAKNIMPFSTFVSEKELLLLPGTKLHVASNGVYTKPEEYQACLDLRERPTPFIF